MVEVGTPAKLYVCVIVIISLSAYVRGFGVVEDGALGAAEECSEVFTEVTGSGGGGDGGRRGRDIRDA